MSVHLMQLDSSGEESLTSLFQSSEERQTMSWLIGLEESAPGVTIFTHRLSEDGFHLCSVPTTFEHLTRLGYYPPRLCGCLTCCDLREFRQEYWAWTTAPEVRDLDMSILEEDDDLRR